MVCVESDLLQLKSAQETCLVPAGTCCSVVLAPYLVTARDRRTAPRWFPCREGRSMEMRMVLPAVLQLSAYNTPHVYAGVFGGSWVPLGEPERAAWTKASRSGHCLPREVSMAAGRPLASHWHASGHWQRHSTLPYPQHQGEKPAFQGSPSTPIDVNDILLEDI